MKYRNCVCAHVSDVLYENPNRMTAVLISLLHGYKSWASMDEEFSDERMCPTRAYRKRRTKQVYEQKRNWKVVEPSFTFIPIRYTEVDCVVYDIGRAIAGIRW